MIALPRRTFLVLGFGAALTLWAGAARAGGLPPNAPDPDSPEFGTFVMNYVDDLNRGRKSHAIMEMKVQTAEFTRRMALEAWSLGTDYSMVRILAPKKERGTATLKAKEDLFTYLNKTGRTIKITGGMMGASWMGSHFTNDDLVKESRLADDYTIEKVFSGDEHGMAVHRFALHPKPDAPVVWGKIEITVRQSDLQPVMSVYFDERGAPVRLLEFEDIQEIEGRTMPMEMTMRPLDKPGEYTQIIYKTIDFDIDIDESFFSLQHLRSM